MKMNPLPFVFTSSPLIKFIGLLLLLFFSNNAVTCVRVAREVGTAAAAATTTTTTGNRNKSSDGKDGQQWYNKDKWYASDDAVYIDADGNTQRNRGMAAAVMDEGSGGGMIVGGREGSGGGDFGSNQPWTNGPGIDDEDSTHFPTAGSGDGEVIENRWVGEAENPALRPATTKASTTTTTTTTTTKTTTSSSLLYNHDHRLEHETDDEDDIFNINNNNNRFVEGGSGDGMYSPDQHEPGMVDTTRKPYWAEDTRISPPPNQWDNSDKGVEEEEDESSKSIGVSIQENVNSSADDDKDGAATDDKSGTNEGKEDGQTTTTEEGEVDGDMYEQSNPTPGGPFDPFFRPGILAAVIGGALVGLLAAILLVTFIIYRMRKKDEGSYALEEPKHPPSYPYSYHKAPNKEFYA